MSRSAAWSNPNNLSGCANLLPLSVENNHEVKQTSYRMAQEFYMEFNLWFMVSG